MTVMASLPGILVFTVGMHQVKPGFKVVTILMERQLEIKAVGQRPLVPMVLS